MRSPRVVATNLLVLVFGLVLGLALAEAASRIMMPNWVDYSAARFMVREYVPGHGITVIGRPGFDGHFAQNNGDFRVRVRINEFGLRTPEPVEKADGRIWIVGDSFSFGWGVEEDQAYSAIVSRDLGAPTYSLANPGTNVCGYQAQVARLPDGLRPRAVIVGLALENDVLMYDCQGDAKRTNLRAARDPAFLSKSDEAGISFIAVKVFFTRYSAFYNFATVALKGIRPFNRALVAVGLAAEPQTDHRHLGEAEVGPLSRSTVGELVNLRAMLPAATPFAVLLIPARFEVRDDDPPYRRLRQALAGELSGRGIGVIDPFDEFKRAGFAATHFAHDGHWSPLGHEIAGRAVARWLASRLP